MMFLKAASAVLFSLACSPLILAQTTTTLNSLARDIQRVESIREVKDVVRSFAQLGQFGRWSDMAALFADNGTLQWGNETATGPKAIEQWLQTDAGNMDGIQPGSLNAIVIECPVATLSVDGQTAKVRYNGLRFQGDGVGGTKIQGGIYENEYVLSNGSWKFSLLHYYPLYIGPYIGGWRNAGGGNLSIVPYHFTYDGSGVAIPPPVGDAANTTASLSQLEQRIARLNDEDTVRNLQHAYGYYVDRRMWPDVVDLFASNTTSSVNISGVGAYTGSAGVLSAMQRMGPENLTQGILNEHLMIDTIVSVDPSGLKAVARGLEMGLIGNANTRAGSWEFNVFRNEFVKEGGMWKIEALHITPLIVANYSTGWGHGSLAPLPTVVPTFLEISERSSRAVDGTAIGGNANLTDLQIQLAKSAAHDGVENLSSAYGYYADDLQSDGLGAVHAVNGHKEVPFTGFYHGADRIAMACHTEYGYPNMSAQRLGISFHWLMQPVILVADDGRSATYRARLLQPSTNWTAPGTFEGGMYSNQAAIENGVWKVWSTGIDEFYWESKDWASGWSGMNPRNESEVFDAPPLGKKYPPDLSLESLGSPREDGFGGGSGRFVEWPEIVRMWWPYRNLVSGRVPESYWPGCVPCKTKPEWNLTSNGYLEPPTGP